MKILITGGCGFLGSNLACHALESGNTLIIIDNLYREGSEKNLEWLKDKGSFDYLKIDVRDAEAVEESIKSCEPEVVFHLAGQVAMTSSIEDPRLDFEVNALGTLNVLEAVRKYAPESPVIYSSTNKVYGDLEWTPYEETETRYKAVDYPDGFPEDIPLDFHSPYGCSKGAGDQYMLDYHRIFGIKTVVFRHSSIFGVRQFATFDQGWIGWFCRKAVEIREGTADGPFSISGTGKQVRDVLFAEDLIRCYFEAVNKIDGISGNAFNIGGGPGNSLSLLELFSYLEHMMDIDMEYTNRPWRISDQKVFIADSTKAEKLLGWKPEIQKQDGIKQMIEWIVSICGSHE